MSEDLPARVGAGRRLEPEDVIESGYERDTLNPADHPIRWWLYLHATRARPQRPRRGVVDRGFHFARGGRVNTVAEAEQCLRLAAIAAAHEVEVWRHQPSHALGPGGSLVPLDEVDRRALGSGS